MYYIVFLEKYDFSPKSGKKPKFSFLPFFSKMIFLNIFHRILVKKIHFGRFDQVSGGGDTSDPRVACQKRLNRCHFLSRHFLIYFDHWKRAGQLSVTSIVQNHAFHNRTTFTNHFVMTSLNMLLSPSKISVQKSKNDIKISIFW